MVSELTGHTRPELPSLSLGQKAFPLLKETLLLATKKQSPAHSSSLGKPVIPSKMNAQGIQSKTSSFFNSSSNVKAEKYHCL
jgi:hypothetical protein